MLIVQYIGMLASLSVLIIAWQGVRQQRLTLGEGFIWLTGGLLGFFFSSTPSLFTRLASMLGFARLSDLIITSLLILVTLLLILLQRRIARLEERLAELARKIAQHEAEREAGEAGE